jgi:hypothetical protein
VACGGLQPAPDSVLPAMQPTLMPLPSAPRPPPQVLGLEDNELASWWEVLRLAWLPRLRRLHLSGNPIAHVWYPAAAAGGVGGGGSGAGAEAAAAAAGAEAAQQQPEQQAACAAAPPPQAGAAFPALEALLLGGCRIGSWADVDQLDCFPALRELRLSGNPLVAGAKSGGRFEVDAPRDRRRPRGLGGV